MDARRDPCLKVMMMTIFVLITQVSLAASQRNRSITANSTGESVFYLWDSSLKTHENCLRFRPEGTPSYFFIWPEPQFRYCCGLYRKTNLSLNQFALDDYVYRQDGPRLQLGMYYDLVSVDQCMPYWKCWNSEPVNTRRVENVQLFYLHCEVGDLKHFYNHRFWMFAVAKCGILMSALPLIAFLEVGVLLATIALRPCGFATSPWIKIFTLWWRTLSRVKFRTWLHLTLLTVVGNCFTEAIAHSDPYSWESFIMDSFAYVYLLLPIAVSIAAFFQQVVDWRVVDKCIRMAREENVSTDVYVKKRNLRAEYMDDDWKWQPIFMQIAILSMVGLYIGYGSDSQRTEFAAWLLGFAAVAATWPALVAVILFCRKLDLLRMSFRRDFLAALPSEQQMSTDPGSKHHQLDSKV